MSFLLRSELSVHSVLSQCSFAIAQSHLLSPISVKNYYENLLVLWTSFLISVLEPHSPLSKGWMRFPCPSPQDCIQWITYYLLLSLRKNSS